MVHSQNSTYYEIRDSLSLRFQLASKNMKLCRQPIYMTDREPKYLAVTNSLSSGRWNLWNIGTSSRYEDKTKVMLST